MTYCCMSNMPAPTKASVINRVEDVTLKADGVERRNA